MRALIRIIFRRSLGVNKGIIRDREKAPLSMLWHEVNANMLNG